MILITLLVLLFGAGICLAWYYLINWEVIRCMRYHRQWHEVKPLEYGSFYYVTCKKCGLKWPQKRP